ncbi:hypothetical protein K9L04_01555 [Patescibacteria group bacterium]|nr:hypothetical protein [Patescibacteria group bacterium]
MEKSICKKCLENNKKFEKWLPISIEKLNKIINRKISYDSKYSHNKNLSYNIQYLEFLDYTLNNTEITSVIYTQNIKTFIIISVSIIETILFNILKDKDLIKKTNLSLLKEINSNESYVFFKKRIKLRTQIFEVLKSYKEEEINLDKIIKISESKDIFNQGKNHFIYKELNYFRKLRNKIHLYLAKTKIETDYNSFFNENLIKTKNILLQILTIYFSLNEEEIKNYFYYLNINK